MPRLTPVSLDQAQKAVKSASREEILQEYMTYIYQVPLNHVGRLTVEQGESAAAVRRRLGDAARRTGRNINIQRKGEAIYFWEHRARRGRRPKYSR